MIISLFPQEKYRDFSLDLITQENSYSLFQDTDLVSDIPSASSPPVDYFTQYPSWNDNSDNTEIISRENVLNKNQYSEKRNEMSNDDPDIIIEDTMNNDSIFNDTNKSFGSFKKTIDIRDLLNSFFQEERCQLSCERCHVIDGHVEVRYGTILIELCYH